MSSLTKIRKRNGDVVSFDSLLIQNAVEKAAISTNRHDLSFIIPLTEEVVKFFGGENARC